MGKQQPPSRRFPIESCRDSALTIARGAPPASMLPTTVHATTDSRPTMSIRPPQSQAYPRALPYAATEPVQHLARGYAPQPAVPVAPLPRNRAPNATPPAYPSNPAPMVRASFEPAAELVTVPVPRYSARRAPRPFLVELAYTLKEFALPISVLMVLAVACGVYLTSGRSKKAAPVASVASVPAPTTRSSLSGAVLAADPSLAPAEKVAPVAAPVVAPAPVPVVAEPVVAPPAPEPVAVAEEPAVVEQPVAEPEIEMAPTKVEKKRAARTTRARQPVVAVIEAPAKKRTVEQPVETREKVKRTSKVDEAELPPNVADKTNGGPGKLVITSNKAALIYLDGRNTGMSAPKKFTVPAGPHKVTLLDPDTRKAKTQDIDIVAGKVATLDKQFQ